MKSASAVPVDFPDTAALDAALSRNLNANCWEAKDRN
jgi:hypothetical protein